MHDLAGNDQFGGETIQTELSVAQDKMSNVHSPTWAVNTEKRTEPRAFGEGGVLSMGILISHLQPCKGKGIPGHSTYSLREPATWATP